MIKSSSKRKWIVGGAMFFGGVALLTTGFATWVIGTQVLKQDGDIGVSVDTAINSSVTMKATLTPDEAFYLGETGVEAGPNTIVSTQEGKAADFDITFTSIEIQCGNDYFNAHFKDNLAFDLTLASKPGATLAEGKVDITEKNSVTDNKIGEEIRKTSGPWTYIDLETKTNNITPGTEVNWTTAESNANIHVLKLTNVTFTFGWGTFFEGEAPSKFYNDNYAKIASDLTKIDAVHQELTAMRAAFEAENGVLPFELSLVPGNVVAA